MTYNPDAVPAEEPIDWDNVTLVPKDGEDTAQTEIQEELTLAPIETSGEGIESAKEEIGEISHETSPSPEVVAAQAAAEAEQIVVVGASRAANQNSYENRAEIRNEIARAKESMWKKIQFWNHSPGASAMDMAQEEALWMNSKIDKASEKLQDMKKEGLSAQELSDVLANESRYSEQLIPQTPEAIRGQEELRSWKENFSKGLSENDYDAVADLLWTRKKIKSFSDEKDLPEAQALLDEKYASFIRENNIEGLVNFFDRDAANRGQLGDFRSRDPSSLPGVTSEMLQTPEIKEFFRDIVIEQLGHYKDPDDFTGGGTVVDSVKRWKEYWLKSRYITEEEFCSLSILSRVAKNDIADRAKIINDPSYNTSTETKKAEVEKRIQEWVNVGAITDEKAKDIGAVRKVFE